MDAKVARETKKTGPVGTAGEAVRSSKTQVNLVVEESPEDWDERRSLKGEGEEKRTTFLRRGKRCVKRINCAGQNSQQKYPKDPSKKG